MLPADVAVLNSATVKDLKLAIRKKTDEIEQAQMGHRHISWYCAQLINYYGATFCILLVFSFISSMHPKMTESITGCNVYCSTIVTSCLPWNPSNRLCPVFFSFYFLVDGKIYSDKYLAAKSCLFCFWLTCWSWLLVSQCVKIIICSWC